MIYHILKLKMITLLVYFNGSRDFTKRNNFAIIETISTNV